jgi:hypothetical protein
MASSEGGVPQHYVDHWRYAKLPLRWADLRGPCAGVAEMPITIDWGLIHRSARFSCGLLS